MNYTKDYGSCSHRKVYSIYHVIVMRYISRGSYIMSMGIGTNTISLKTYLLEEIYPLGNTFLDNYHQLNYAQKLTLIRKSQ